MRHVYNTIAHNRVKIIKKQNLTIHLNQILDSNLKKKNFLEHALKQFQKNSKMSKGQIQLILGPMFSGKTYSQFS